jgi:hypothetical protein
MAPPRFYAPLRPDLHNFLFATVGEERNGIPLSMISALAQLGLDPWDEASRLCSLAKQEAVERLAGLILRLPGTRRPSEARQIAFGLIDVLPTHNGPPGPVESIGRLKPQNIAPGKTFWLICLALAMAAFILMRTQSGLLSGNPQPPSTANATEIPVKLNL